MTDPTPGTRPSPCPSPARGEGTLRLRLDYSSGSGEQAGTWRVPLVLLIDHDSASASEIFAGAIRDHRRGTVVGSLSYGKGSVQGIFPLSVGGSGVRLTTAKFYSPSGNPISKRGVTPDIVVREVAKPAIGDAGAAGEKDDPVLRAGVEAARRRPLSR